MVSLHTHPYREVPVAVLRASALRDCPWVPLPAEGCPCPQGLGVQRLGLILMLSEVAVEGLLIVACISCGGAAASGDLAPSLSG